MKCFTRTRHVIQYVCICIFFPQYNAREEKEEGREGQEDRQEQGEEGRRKEEEEKVSASLASEKAPHSGAFFVHALRSMPTSSLSAWLW